MKYSLKPVWKWATLVLLLIGTGLACNFSGSSSDDARQETAQALAESIRSTSTAAAMENPGFSAPVNTAVAQATESNLALQATTTALNELDLQAQAATATAAAPFIRQLPIYGVDPEAGLLAWIHPPVSLSVEGYMQYDFANQFIGMVAKDFVISADITWNTQFGTSGCGFVLRSDGNEETGNQYLAIITRGASGHLLFGVMAEGELVTGQDIYAYGIDRNFQMDNDTTNRLTIVGIGNQFTVYTNDVKLGDINPSDPPPALVLPPAPVRPEDIEDIEAMRDFAEQQKEYQEVIAEMSANYNARVNAFKEADTVYDRGLVAMVVLSESGRTQCEFNNAWLWLINQ